jgi:hypothetical protein
MRYVFVGGVHRSGTSLVHRALREHPEITGFAGTGAHEDEGQHLQDVLPTARDFGGPGRFAFDGRAHATEADADRFDRGRLIAAWEPHWDGRRAIRVEKSPIDLLRFRLLQAWFPGCVCVAVVRHPAAVAFATRGLRRRERFRSLRELLLHWAIAHERFLADRPFLADVLTIRLEDAFAARSLAGCEVWPRLGLTAPQGGEGIAQDRNDGYAARWQQALRRGAVPERVLRRVGATAAAFGYAIDVVPASISSR